MNRLYDGLNTQPVIMPPSLSSTLYSSLEHTDYYSQFTTRRFLVTAPTMDIPLPPAQILSSQTPVQNYFLTLSLVYKISTRTTQKTQIFYCSPVVALLRICCLATRTCLPSCCPETAMVYPSISLSLHNSSSTR
jgi:hypothetical protein